jgi:cell division protein FtsW (lipid II flippase)
MDTKYIKGHINMNNFKEIISYFLMLPAIFIGTLAMVSYGVTSSIWIQNIIIWILGTLLGSVFLIRTKGKNCSKGNFSYTFIIIALLVLPFWFNDLDGVHRWLSFGPFNLYIASIILPLLIIHLWKLALNNRERYAIGISFITLVILLFHPDAGQLTAFACATAIILWKKISNKLIKLLSITLTATLGIVSWVFLDDLAPVPYVEHIIFLVADLGNVWFILGVLSLILLLSPFFFFGKKNIISLSLGVYFLMTMIVTLFGNFPMPIMGYGTSPVIGYLIAITWLNKNK